MAMPLPRLDCACARKKRRAPRALSAAPKARTGSGLRGPGTERDAGEPRGAHEVQQQEGAEHDLDVADGEHVVDREPARRVEDVAEEAQRRALGRGGIRALV